jgi:hypothetical protein
MKTVALIAVFALSVTGLSSCKKEDAKPGTSMNTASPEKGSFKVRLTDSPGNYSGLFVELTRVDAYIQNQGWVNLSSESRVISVLDLTNGAETTLSYNAHAQAGVYTKLKLTFGNENTLVLNGVAGSSTIALNFGSQSSHEVVVDIHEEVNAQSSGEVLLDFNVAQSILAMGTSYLMNPNITEIENESTGISGDVQGSAQASVTLHNGQHSYHTFVSASGEFLIRGVEDGTYQLSIEGMVQGNAMLQHHEIDNVTIVEGQIKQMGAIEL